MKLWCVSTAYECSLVLGNTFVRFAFADLRSEFVFIMKPESGSNQHSEVIISMYSIMVSLLRVSTSESMIPRPCFQALKHRLQPVLLHVCLLLFLFQIAITTHNHPYYLYFTISSPNQCTYTPGKCIGCVGDTRDFLYRNCRVP